MNVTLTNFDVLIRIWYHPGTGSQAIFLESLPVSPYTVYGTTFGGDKSCGNVISIDDHGSLSHIIQSFDYGTGSGVHGLAIGSNNDILYSADDSGNSLWRHSINSETGQVEFLDRIAAPTSGSDPRHITIHPNGKFAYVVFEKTNKLALYSIDTETNTLAYTKSFPLVPLGKPER